jgi:uncharacterized protein YndB with AHSA1/START domain
MKVFDAWLNPKTMSNFMMGMPGMPEPDVETDAREGGNFAINMHYRGEKFPPVIAGPLKISNVKTCSSSTDPSSTIFLQFQ